MSDDDEKEVRRTLARLEAGLREVALLALGSWQGLGLVAPEDMFAAVASLSRPAWGSWNGLLLALSKARRAALRQASAAERERIERQAEFLHRALAWLDERILPEEAGTLRPLAARPPATALNEPPDVQARPQAGAGGAPIGYVSERRPRATTSAGARAPRVSRSARRVVPPSAPPA